MLFEKKYPIIELVKYDISAGDRKSTRREEWKFPHLPRRGDLIRIGSDEYRVTIVKFRMDDASVSILAVSEVWSGAEFPYAADEENEQ